MAKAAGEPTSIWVSMAAAYVRVAKIMSSFQAAEAWIEDRAEAEKIPYRVASFDPDLGDGRGFEIEATQIWQGSRDADFVRSTITQFTLIGTHAGVPRVRALGVELNWTKIAALLQAEGYIDPQPQPMAPPQPAPDEPVKAVKGQVPRRRPGVRPDTLKRVAAEMVQRVKDKKETVASLQDATQESLAEDYGASCETVVKAREIALSELSKL
jgi:hypothetical protein